ncbi:MAG: hypothetical protein HC906_16545, partial [Bacteroidales bacterium]|nr:hypothetical protein [Bacteroidales bacterium]
EKAVERLKGASVYMVPHVFEENRITEGVLGILSIGKKQSVLHMYEERNMIIVADASIYNKSELGISPEVMDAEFILQAYLKWGKSCLKYLLGDFAFAIWDTKKKNFFVHAIILG